MSGKVSRAGTPWYQIPNTGRRATRKKRCTLLIAVERRGTFDTAHVCESGSDLSKSFDAIFLRAEEVEAVGAGADEEASEHSSRSHACFCNGNLRAGSHSHTMKPRSPPADPLPQVGERPNYLGANNP